MLLTQNRNALPRLFEAVCQIIWQDDLWNYFFLNFFMLSSKMLIKVLLRQRENYAISEELFSVFDWVYRPHYWKLIAFEMNQVVFHFVSNFWKSDHLDFWLIHQYASPVVWDLIPFTKCIFFYFLWLTVIFFAQEKF